MIAITEFKGEIPILANEKLPIGYASSAINCDLRSGSIEPSKGVTSEQDVDAGAETIYRMGTGWLQWNNKINVIESLVFNSGSRIVLTGDNYPKETNSTLALSSAPYPTSTRRLGISAPSAAPDYNIDLAGSGTPRDIAYVYTVVGEWEDGTIVESAPSPSTAVFSANDDATITIDNFVAPTETGTYYTHYYVYRILDGTAGATFNYLGKVAYDASPLEYVDTTADADVGEAIESTDWTAPTDDIKGIISVSSGLAFAFDDNVVYVSDSFVSYAYPDSFKISVGSEIVGLGFNGNAVVVLTKTSPFFIYGSDPEALTLEKSSSNYPCKSARSIVNIPGGVLFASDVGICFVDSGGNVSNLTKALFDKEQWSDLSPDTIFSFYHDSAYLCFFESSINAIEIRPEENYIRRFELDTPVFGGQYVSTVSIDLYDLLDSDSKNFLTSEGYQFIVQGSQYSITYDTLYLIKEKSLVREIVAWNSGSNETFTWESGDIFNPHDSFYTAGLISGDFSSGSIDFTLYIDGVSSFTKTVTSGDFFRITGQNRGTTFKVSLSGNIPRVDNVYVGTSIMEIMRNVA